MPNARVYIGRLSNDAREGDVERLFKKYGHIREVSLKNGFGFVEYDDDRDADDAVRALDGEDFLGQRLRVEIARGGRERGSSSYSSSSRSGGARFGPAQRTHYRVVVENVSSRTSWQDLKDFMRQVAEVGYADVHHPREGEGIVEFASRRDMEDAIRKLDGAECNGRRLRLYEEGGRRGRSRSRSPARRSRSRSPAGRRSRSPARRSSRSPARRSRSPVARRSRSRSASPKARDNGSARRDSRSPSPAADRKQSESPKGRGDRSPSRD